MQVRWRLSSNNLHMQGRHGAQPRCVVGPSGIAAKTGNTATIYRRFKESKTFMLAVQGGFPSVPCGAACAKVDCAWGSHCAAELLEHISLRVIAILFVRAEKLVSVEDAPSTPLRSAPGGRYLSSHAYGFRFDGKFI